MPGTIDNAESPLGAFFALMGAQADTHPRVLGFLDEADFKAVLQTWQYTHPNEQQARAPSPVVLAQAGLIGRVCRIAIGKEKTLAKLELERQAATVASQAQANTNAASGTQGRKVKMSLIVNQTNDDERPLLDDAGLDKAYKQYIKVMGDVPSPDRECTAEQLTAIKSLLDDNSVPYADFALWGPHGYRLLRKVKLTGLMMMPGGEMRNVELSGPATHGLWEGCHGILFTALISHDAVGIAALTDYADLIKMYVARYGEGVWHIIYQADHRQRHENMERHRRRGLQEHADATGAGRSHPLDPNRPWDWVWRQAVRDITFWRRELEEPCLLVLSKVTSSQTFVDGDANIQPPRQQNGGRGQKRNLEEIQTVRTTRAVDARAHNFKDGIYETNRRGVPLCPGFQNGSCKESTGTNRCSKDWSMSHQCNKCLSTEHGSDRCNSSRSPKAPSLPPRNFQSNKGGKGKKAKGKGKW